MRNTIGSIILAAIIGAGIGTAVSVADSGEEDKACTDYGTCVIVAPTEDSCPAYTGDVVGIQGGGVVCFPG